MKIPLVKFWCCDTILFWIRIPCHFLSKEKEAGIPLSPNNKGLQERPLPK